MNNSIIKKRVCFWKVKQRKQKILQTFLKTYNLKLIVKRETSIVLSCLTPTLNNKTGKYDLVTDDGIALETNISKSEVSKKMEEYSKAAKKKKISLQEHLDEIIKKKRNLFKGSRMTEMKDTFVDINGSGIYAPHEIESFADLEIKFNMTVRASLANEAGDIIAVNGKFPNKSLDPLGLSSNAISSWRKDFDKLWNEKRQFVRSIDKHFKKIHSPEPGKPPLDKVVLDFRHMDDVGNSMKQKVMDYIYNDLEVGGRKFPVQYQQYLNNDNFIILNF